MRLMSAGLAWIVGAGLSIGAASAQQQPELTKVRLAVGGKSAIFYLPLAIVSSDPMISLMESEGLVTAVADARTADGTRAVYGGPYPGGVVYAAPAFIERNPRTAQAVVTAFVRALKWMAASSAEQIANAMPEEYSLGNRSAYVRALAASRAMYSPDGRFVPGAAVAAHDVLRMFDPAVASAKIDLDRTFVSSFVEKAASAD